MTTQTQRNESTAPLYVALELGNSKWKLLSAVRLGARARTVSIAAGDLAAVDSRVDPPSVFHVPSRRSKAEFIGRPDCPADGSIRAS